jgi:mannitol 2-dehydrogenase
VPTYNRENVKTGIVHVGVGGFHRAHEAMYIDQLLHDESNSNWEFVELLYYLSIKNIQYA